MPATAEDLDGDLVEQAPAVCRLAAREEDAYWQRNFRQERYYRCDLDYEDYAPAYCVGYIGCTQYGGDFADAERSLWANWERIKCDSRLSLSEAMPAIKAAWDRTARVRERRNAVPANEPVYEEASLRRSPRVASFAPGPAAAAS
jgi:hypothetical protein